MKILHKVPLLLAGAAVLAGTPLVAAHAQSLPAIRLSETNRVPACVTPERLMTFLRKRHPQLPMRYNGLAEYYKEHGEKTRVRWDYAFFQAMLETNYLKYRTGSGRPGDDKPDSNNFAGIGTTGGGVEGNRFKDVSTGVLAQMHHLVVYSGERMANPVAPRTREKMDEILGWTEPLAKRRPVTYRDLTNKWAIDSNYARSIRSVADSFYSQFCNGREQDAQPAAAQRIASVTVDQEARLELAASSEKPGRRKKQAGQEEQQGENAGEGTRKADAGNAGEDKPRRRGERRKVRSRGEGKERSNVADAGRNGERKGDRGDRRKARFKYDDGDKPTEEGEQQPQRQAAEDKPRGARGDAGEKTADSGGLGERRRRADRGQRPAAPEAAKEAAKADEEQQDPADRLKKADQPAQRSALGGAGLAKSAAKPVTGPCNVFTASYGGKRAVLIQAQAGQTASFTVLEVNGANAQREAEAYIAAYAKGGVVVGEFGNQNDALRKAFELCPE